MGSCVPSACVVTGVAARRIATAATGLETTRGKNDSSAYCRIPRVGSRPSWRPPRRRYVAGFCARASYPIRYRSADSAHSSYEDAPPGASDSCRSVVATPTSQNFWTIERAVSRVRSPSPTPSARSHFRMVPQNRAARRTCMSRSFACGASVLRCTRTDVHWCVALHNQQRRQRLPDSALSSLVIKMVRSDDTLISFRRSVKVLRFFNTISRK